MDKKPTWKQIKFAKDLDIEIDENETRESLAKKISEKYKKR